MVNCKNCGKLIRNPKYNQIYCTVECRCEECAKEIWEQETNRRLP